MPEKSSTPSTEVESVFFVANEWADLCERFLGIPLTLDALGFVSPINLVLSEKALNTWIAFYNEYGAYMNFLSVRIQLFLSKLLDYYSLKFAGIIHVLQCFENNKEINTAIEEDTVITAIELTKFFLWQAVQTLNLYNTSGTLSYPQKKIIAVLYELKDEVLGGLLPLAKIHERFNKELPESLQVNPKQIGSLLKSLDLQTQRRAHGYALIWNVECIEQLFSKNTFTTFTTFTESDSEEENQPEMRFAANRDGFLFEDDEGDLITSNK